MRHNKRKEEELNLRYAYEDACDALKYQYTKKFWDKSKLSSIKANKIWKMALQDVTIKR